MFLDEFHREKNIENVKISRFAATPQGSRVDGCQHDFPVF